MLFFYLSIHLPFGIPCQFSDPKMWFPQLELFSADVESFLMVEIIDCGGLRWKWTMLHLENGENPVEKEIPNLEKKKTTHFFRFYVKVRGPYSYVQTLRYLDYPPGNESISHRKGKGKSSTRKCLRSGYVSSLEGILHQFSIKTLQRSHSWSGQANLGVRIWDHGTTSSL